jgi:hypothetical protein
VLHPDPYQLDRIRIGKVEGDAAPQEGLGQLALAVGGYDGQQLESVWAADADLAVYPKALGQVESASVQGLEQVVGGAAGKAANLGG